MIVILGVVAAGAGLYINGNKSDIDSFEKSQKSNNVIGNEIKFTELNKGYNNAIGERRQMVIKNSADWADLWTEMFPTQMIAPIPLNDDMIIAVFMGEKNSGGYEIKITKILEDDDSLNVFVDEISPGKNCATTQALTQPYHVVQLEKSEKRVEFNFNEKIAEC